MTTDIKPSVPCTPVEMPDLRNELMSSWVTKRSWRVAEQQAISTTGIDMSQHSLDQSILAQVKILEMADLYWVGSDMCDLLYQLVDKVPLDTKASEIAWPSRFGLIVFSRPFVGVDSGSGERDVAVDALVWGRGHVRYGNGPETREAMHLSFYRCLDWSKGLSEVEMLLAGSMDLQNSARRATVYSEGKIAQIILTGRSWMPLGRSTWPVDATIDDIHENPNFSGGTELNIERFSSMVEDRRLMASLFSLLDSKRIVEITEQGMPRAVQRREQRAGKKTEPSKVKVVYLRRTKRAREDAEHSGGTWHLDHRIVVNEYQKMQHYGPGGSLRRLQTISSHVKGPDDTPVIIKETVKALVR